MPMSQTPLYAAQNLLDTWTPSTDVGGDNIVTAPEVPDDETNSANGHRDTVLSIDSVLLRSDANAATASSSLIPAPVYIPTGLKPGIKSKDGKLRAQSSHFKRLTSSSGVSALRRYASYHSGDGGSQVGSEKDDHRKSIDSDDFVLGAPPIRQLRRRPGGDLKAVDKVHDLETTPRHRRNSTGSSIIDSIALPSRSLPSVPPGVELDSEVTPKKRKRPSRKNSDGTALQRKSISLIQTHSSQPNLRPSFEAEVAKLAALPDDLDDDGGVDAALLKLEGRYEKKTPGNSPIKEDFPPETPVRQRAESNATELLPESAESRKLRHHKEHVGEIHSEEPLPGLTVQSTSIHHISQSSGALSPTVHARHKPANSVAATEDSYSSIPLLQRGVSSVVPKATSMRRQQQSSRFQGDLHAAKKLFEGQQKPKTNVLADGEMHQSFLFGDTDGSDNGYDPYDLTLQSPDGHDHDDLRVRSFYDDEIVDEMQSTAFSHPLRHPDTPPAGKGLDSVHQIQNHTTTTFNQGLPTPGLTPTLKDLNLPMSPISPLHPPMPSKPIVTESATLRQDNNPARFLRPPMSGPPAHLPFILAYDPQTLAQQFTLIEKDALDEIDWRELIELRWKQASPYVNNWVSYLRTADPHGVDLVIARFNLMVKWLLSELALTELIEERVRCVVQYIRIAEACRVLRNFATLYQITVALGSAECSGLKRTWEAVPEREVQVFRTLERLVSPVRNFQNLRREMEMGSGSAEEGCIPFIGIYTRDLVYNSQKPAIITTPPLNANEPLVNFERHHTAASIVKSLLRLLEASAKYNFKVEPEVVKKCLWMSALSDEEIGSRCAALD